MTPAQDEARFRQLAENFTGVFWLAEPGSNGILYVSPGFELIWGRSSAELHASPLLWIESIHPEDRERVRAARAQAGQGAYDEEYRVLRPDGAIVWIHDRAFPVRNADGQVHRIAGIAEDITRRHQAEEALKHAGILQREMVEQLMAEKDRLVRAQAVAKVGSWETDLTTGTVRWSDETHRIFETDPQRFQPTHAAFLERVHPDDVRGVEAAFARSATACEPGEHEHRICVPSGVKTVRERWEVICGEGGRPVLAVGTCQDVSDRKILDDEFRQSEARFRAIFEHAGSGLVVADVDGRLLRCNPRFCELVGYTEPELCRMSVEDLSDPGDYVADRAQWPGLFGGEVDRFQMEKRLRRKDGETIWTWLTVTVVRTARKSGQFMIGMVEDISARKRAEAELRDVTASLHRLVERLNSAREDEAKRIARELHDNLGQHLTALNLKLDRLERRVPGLTPAERNEFQQLHRVVDDCIEVVQKIAGALRDPRLHLLGLVAAIEWRAQEFSESANIPVRFIPSHPIAAVTEATGIAFVRILQEALTNVARHASATEVTLRLEHRGGQLVLQVEDNGRGIAAEAVRDQRSIGLLGMHERALLAGGACSITRGPGGGTIVTVAIPCPS